VQPSPGVGVFGLRRTVSPAEEFPKTHSDELVFDDSRGSVPPLGRYPEEEKK
jgi:hypothetical protein